MHSVSQHTHGAIKVERKTGTHWGMRSQPKTQVSEELQRLWDWRQVCIKPQKEQASCVTETLLCVRVSATRFLFLWPLRFCAGCDCSSPFLFSVPEAAVIVVMWGFFASSSLFVLREFRETRELEQAVETTLPWERQPRRPPRWLFWRVREAMRPCWVGGTPHPTCRPRISKRSKLKQHKIKWWSDGKCNVEKIRWCQLTATTKLLCFQVCC